MDTATVRVERRLPWRRGAVLAGITALSVTALVWAIVVTRSAPEPAVNTANDGILYTTPLARLVTNGAAIMAVGAVLLILLLGTAGREQFSSIAARARMIAIAAGIAWVTATTTTWWLQAAELSASGASMPFAGMASYAVRVNSGSALALTVVVAAIYTALALARAPRGWAAACLGLATVGLVAVPVTGHASQTEAAWLTTPAICLHLCAVSSWVGGLGLITLLVAANRSALAVVLPRFSSLAGLAIATVAVTGVMLAGPRLTKDATPGLQQFISALFGTPSGWLILGKVAGMMILAATGGYIRQFLLPAVRRHETAALATVAAIELTVMAVTIALATALARPL